MPNVENLAQGLRKAIVSALNKTAASARKQFIREIAKKWGIDQRDLARLARRRIFIIKARPGKLVAVVQTARWGMIPLIFFQARQEPPGASVEVIRGDRQVQEHAFIQTGRKSGRRNIFKRLGLARYPIKRLPGVHISVPFADVVRDVDRMTGPTLEKFITKELQKIAKDNG